MGTLTMEYLQGLVVHLLEMATFYQDQLVMVDLTLEHPWCLVVHHLVMEVHQPMIMAPMLDHPQGLVVLPLALEVHQLAIQAHQLEMEVHQLEMEVHQLEMEVPQLEMEVH